MYSDELLLASGKLSPVAVLDGGGVAGALLLLLHLDVERSLVDGEAVLAADELCQVEGETVGVEQTESLLTTQLLPRSSFLGARDFSHSLVKQGDTLVEGTEERVLLLLDDAADERLLGLQLGEGVAHLLDERGQQLIQEGLLLSKERVGVAYGTAQDAADDVAGLGVARQLTVGDGEGDGTQVVGADAHGDVDVVLLLCDGSLLLFLKRHVLQSGNLLLGLDDGLEDVGVVVRVLALHHADETLEAHAGIDDVHRQGLQRTVGLAVELHEHDIPDLDDLRVVLIHQLTTALAAGGTLFGCARVDVDLRAGTAGPRVAHLPEVVVLVAVDDVVDRHVLGPVLGSLVVARDVLLGGALKDGNIEILRIQLQHVHQVLPRHIDSALLEVVTERPVAEHLEHRVVVCVVAHLLQVVVLTADAQALLRVGTAARLRVART